MSNSNGLELKVNVAADIINTERSGSGSGRTSSGRDLGGEDAVGLTRVMDLTCFSAAGTVYFAKAAVLALGGWAGRQADYGAGIITLEGCLSGALSMVRVWSNLSPESPGLTQNRYSSPKK